MSVPNPSTTEWVPLWGGGGVGGAELTYEGTWDAGTAYEDGDVVVYNGVTYIAVRPTTGVPPLPWPGGGSVPGPRGPVGAGVPTPVVNGQWVKGVAGAAVWSPFVESDLPLISYGTSLPASPFNGQEAILVDSVANPSYQWHFRYNAGSSSAYKWEFVGGSSASARNPASGDTFESITTAVGAYGSTATVGPVITLLRAGEYDVFITAYASIGSIDNWTNVSMICEINTAGNWLQPYIQAFTNVHPVVPYSTFGAFTRGVGIPAGAVIRCVYGCPSKSGGGNPTVGRRQMTIWPVRVS